VRAELAARGIAVPAATWFVAAEHDTTTDRVRLFAQEPPAVHAEALRRLEADLARAGERNAAERLAALPAGAGRAGAPASTRARRRSADWAQTRPEWGLAGNAAFLVAPRSLSTGVDLGGRVFLHSYDPAGDVEGRALETILTAPMVVAHWINMQYYGSTVDPQRWGAGDKTLHNPVAGVGVLEGVGGDLRAGLPWQSVAGFDGPRHEPVRLCTVVVAPQGRVEGIIERNPILQELFDGAWVHLVVVEPGSETWRRRLPGGSWVAVASSDSVDGRAVVPPSAGGIASTEDGSSATREVPS
jgi:hypothetical protein